MHILIVGGRGVGKSTLIRRLLQQLALPTWGFETKKEDGLADAEKGSPIYIYDMGCEHRQSEENLIGHCRDEHAVPCVEAFDRYAARLAVPVPQGHIIVMDELGFMEARSEEFCAAVLGLLDGSQTVIAAVKDKEVPFLQRVRRHPGAKCFYITEENRDELYWEVLAFMTEQIEPAQRADVKVAAGKI